MYVIKRKKKCDKLKPDLKIISKHDLQNGSAQIIFVYYTLTSGSTGIATPAQDDNNGPSASSYLAPQMVIDNKKGKLLKCELHLAFFLFVWETGLPN